MNHQSSMHAQWPMTEKKQKQNNKRPTDTMRNSKPTNNKIKKRPHKRRTLQEKQEIIRQFSHGRKQNPALSKNRIAKTLELPYASLHDLLDTCEKTKLNPPVFSSELDNWALQSLDKPKGFIRNSLQKKAHEIREKLLQQNVLSKAERQILKVHTFSDKWMYYYMSGFENKVAANVVTNYANVTNCFQMIDESDKHALKKCWNMDTAYLVLKAQQIDDDDPRSPLVIPNKSTNYKCNMSEEEKRTVSRNEMKKHGNNNKGRVHRKSVYSGEYIHDLGEKESMLIIDTQVYKRGVLIIEMLDEKGKPNGMTTKVSFNDGSVPEIQALTTSCKELGRYLTVDLKCRPYTVRNGTMAKLYHRQVNGKKRGVTEPGPHNDNVFVDVRHCSVNKAAKTFCKDSMKRVHDDIEIQLKLLKTKVPWKIGGEKGLGVTLFQSLDLENSAHYDNSDLSKCFVHWCSSDGNDHEGWYFVMPSLHVNFQGKLYNGISIKIRNGNTIEWDGKQLRHCQTRQINCKGVHTFGTWFGVTSA